jgi:ubiquitin-protein ligase
MPKKWYRSNHRLFLEDRESLTRNHPFLKLKITAPGTPLNSVVSLKREAALVSGIYRLMVPESQRYRDYRIAVVLPDNYPKNPPVMYCNDEKLPIGNIDRHIMNDGRACLGVQGEISTRWSSGSTITNFLDSFVAPFLAWQAYYEDHQKAPPWGERSHYKQGVLEFYAELLRRPVDSSIVGFMRLLARKNLPKGHEPCPCGSGERLRNCHRDLLYKVRERIAWQHVAHDLEALVRGDGAK